MHVPHNFARKRLHSSRPRNDTKLWVVVTKCPTNKFDYQLSLLPKVSSVDSVHVTMWVVNINEPDSVSSNLGWWMRAIYNSNHCNDSRIQWTSPFRGSSGFGAFLVEEQTTFTFVRNERK